MHKKSGILHGLTISIWSGNLILRAFEINPFFCRARVQLVGQHFISSNATNVGSYKVYVFPRSTQIAALNRFPKFTALLMWMDNFAVSLLYFCFTAPGPRSAASSAGINFTERGLNLASGPIKNRDFTDDDELNFNQFIDQFGTLFQRLRASFDGYEFWAFYSRKTLPIHPSIRSSASCRLLLFRPNCGLQYYSAFHLEF